MQHVSYCSYLEKIFKPELREIILREATAYAQTHDFTHWAVRGFSGSLLGLQLQDRTGKPIVFVRKKTDHRGNWTEGQPSDVHTYVFFDDLISTGQTFRELRERLPDATCVGVFLYEDSMRHEDTYDNFPIHAISHETFYPEETHETQELCKN